MRETHRHRVKASYGGALAARETGSLDLGLKDLAQREATSIRDGVVSRKAEAVWGGGGWQRGGWARGDGLLGSFHRKYRKLHSHRGAL